MSIFLILLLWILIFILYFMVEFSISIFFNYKISFVSKDNFKSAAIMGSISTFLFVFTTILAMLFSTNVTLIKTLFNDDSINSVDDIEIWMQIVFLLYTTFAFSTGNFTATILIPRINKKFEKIKNRRLKEKSEWE